MSGGVGIYTSTYKRDFLWPPHVPRKAAGVEDPRYRDLCGQAEDCGAGTCLCRPASLRAPARPEDCGEARGACPPEPLRGEGRPEDWREESGPRPPDCEPPESWRYLAGVKSLYGDSYDRPVRLQPVRRRYRGPAPPQQDFAPPESHFPNPFMLAEDTFRPGLGRPVSGRGFPSSGRVSPRPVLPEPTLQDLGTALQFPPELQQLIARRAAKAEKLALQRARPRAAL